MANRELNLKKSAPANTISALDVKARTPEAITTSIVSTNPKGYTGLGTRINNWTSNIISTAIVIVIAVVGGAQLASSWSVPKQKTPELLKLADAWPSLEHCSLEFGTSAIQLAHQTFMGDEAATRAFLVSLCKQTMLDGAEAAGPVGKRESVLLAHSKNRSPIEQSEGHWRVFAGGESSEVSVLPMAFGIRDNLKPDDSVARSGSETTSRLAVWAIAVPGQITDNWTTLVGTASTHGQDLGVEGQMIPADSQRTMSISDQGGSIIGFQGGEIRDAFTYYDNLAQSQAWKIKQPWHRTGETWTSTFIPKTKSVVAGIHVRLNANHTELSSGILIFQLRVR